VIPTSSPIRAGRFGRRLAAVALPAVLVFAACGDDDDDAEPAATTEAADTTAMAADTTAAAADTTSPADTAASVETTAAADAADGGSVAIGDTDLGSVLVDGEGMTLYVFIPDAQGPSTCEDACLDNWPALAGPVTAGEGVDADLLGTATRPDDGSDQATYDDWPLYYFAADLGPGDVSGQGIGDVWYAIDAAGDPMNDA